MFINLLCRTAAGNRAMFLSACLTIEISLSSLEYCALDKLDLPSILFYVSGLHISIRSTSGLLITPDVYPTPIPLHSTLPHSERMDLGMSALDDIEDPLAGLIRSIDSSASIYVFGNLKETKRIAR